MMRVQILRVSVTMKCRQARIAWLFHKIFLFFCSLWEFEVLIMILWSTNYLSKKQLTIGINVTNVISREF